jgi:hypothetical protein
VGSLKKMFDRTGRCINRAMDWLSGMNMCDVCSVMCIGCWVTGDGTGCGKLEVRGWS